uniref:Secreted protein n=1 Tax=Opuntia streptacantha TaxID=393608 RepID=A0A7C9E2U1_OPUST
MRLNLRLLFFSLLSASSNCLVSSSILWWITAALLSANCKDFSAVDCTAIAASASSSFNFNLLFDTSKAALVFCNSLFSMSTNLSRSSTACFPASTSISQASFHLSTSSSVAFILISSSSTF